MMRCFSFFPIKLITSVIILSCIGCGPNANEKKLKNQVETLEAKLSDSQEFSTVLVSKLNKVDVLIDSIRKSEEIIAFNLEKGTTYEDHIDRLRGLTAFVEYSRQKIIQAENDLLASNNENQALLTLIRKLRKELNEKDEIITRLTEQVAKYKAENQDLIKLVDFQKREIIDMEQEIKMKISALTKAERDLDVLKQEKQMIKADAYFDKAEAAEEIATKIKFASKKKQENLQEAYELYRLSYNEGRLDAKEKMEALEKKLN
ncbi:MAG: hypothetical protein KTR26_18200 [Flammeovirgaceae bacterium]|nr:hypothetical protein [Flammeovirgaceae bacterium]